MTNRTRSGIAPGWGAWWIASCLVSAGCAAEVEGGERDLALVLSELQSDGRIAVDLGSSQTDERVMRDAVRLTEELTAGLVTIHGPAAVSGPSATVRFVGRGKFTESPEFPPPPELGNERTAAAAEPIREWRVFVPGTNNLFSLEIAAETAVATRELAKTRSLDQPSNKGEAGPRMETLVPKGWSTNFDNRTRRGTLNTAHTFDNYRRAADFNASACTGSLYGPRHFITAAHCVNTYGTNTFFGFTARYGRNGTAWNATSTVSPTDVNALYITPANWQAGTGGVSTQYDIALVVLPNRPGDSQGFFGYALQSDTRLQQLLTYRNGYPVCNGVQNGMNRIDDPADPTPATGSGSNLTVCNENHLYGVPADCGLGNFANSDGTWNRNFDHSCDASMGDSGSALYLYGDGLDTTVVNWTYIFGLESSALCGAFATSPACTSGTTFASRAVRLTQEYYDAMSFTRAVWP